MQLCVFQSASAISKARRFLKRKFAKKDRREADSSNSHAVTDMCSEFAEVKPELLLRFGADDGDDNDESAFTMVVWDFGGQRVSCVMRISADAIAAHESCSAMLFLRLATIHFC